MKFITLTTYLDDSFDKNKVKATVNSSQIVMMKDMRNYSNYINYSTEIELANKSILLVEESIEEILDMINKR